MPRQTAFLAALLLAAGTAGLAAAQDDPEADCVSALSDQANVDREAIEPGGTEPSLGEGANVHLNVDGSSWTCSVDDNGDIVGLEPDDGGDSLLGTGDGLDDGFNDGAVLDPYAGGVDGN